MTSLKMITFYTKQTVDRKVFIENKAKGLKNLRNKVPKLNLFRSKTSKIGSNLRKIGFKGNG